ncbi:arylamine N-acetyltransferase, partial [Klebsiella pneumoniae]|nr:arylamine N-acetyltransferase [Klebsiella pneumoniae]EIW8500573.1 arylamine N-acetyltransferase [Klebsiella pneumoniae]
NLLKTITAEGIETQQLMDDGIALALKNRFALPVPQYIGKSA